MQKAEPGEAVGESLSLNGNQQGFDDSAKKRRTNFSEIRPPPKGPVSQPKLEENLELHLGCFEMSGASAVPRKRPRPASPPNVLKVVKATAQESEEQAALLANGETFEIGAGTAPGRETAEIPEPPAQRLPEPQKPQQNSEARAEASRAAKEQSERREREYFKPYIGEPCGPGNRFLVEGPLGRGSFSSVYRCSDTKSLGKEYAVKFIRDNPALRKATEAEVRLMRRIRTKAVEKDSEGAKCLLGLAGVETFMHQGHLALIFHLQRCDLATALRRGGRGFPLQDLEGYASDLFMALRALRAIRIIHTDIKPDNLLMSLDKKSVKLSDFGCAVDTQSEEQLNGIKHIRRAYSSSYRAPEIILGQQYSSRSDMWSAGATFYELAVGQVLFPESSSNKMIHDMLNTCGPFKKAFATAGKSAMRHFDLEGTFKRKKTNGNEQLLPMRSFAKPLTPLLGRLQQKLQDVKLNDFAGLLGRCLLPDPAERLAPEEALQHRFVRKSE